MKNNNFIIFLLMIALAFAIFIIISKHQPTEENTNIVDRTISCMELWEKKKERLFGEEIGNYRVIWSQKFNTCLAGNIYNAPTYFNGGQKSYSIFIIDLLTDETLFSFMLSGDEQEDGGMTFEGAIKKYESFGLKV